MKINIVEDKERKKINGTAVTIAVLTLLLLIPVGLYLFMNKAPSDYSDYKVKEKIYTTKNIDYSYSDYKQDEKVAKQNVTTASAASTVDKDNNYVIKNTALNNKKLSVPTQKLIVQDNKIISDLKNDSMVDTNVDEIKISIINQSKNMNEFIINHCGYPDSKFGDDYNASKEYIDSLVSSMVPNSNQPEIQYGQSIEDAQAEIRYCISENLQYHMSSNFTKYKDCLNNWMKTKHLSIVNIDTISFEKPNAGKMFDSLYSNNLNATIISNKQKYKIYLSSQIVDGKAPIYKILDIQLD